MVSKDENEEMKIDPFAETEVEFTGGRPWIRKDAKAPEYRVNQSVYVNLGTGREGPYVVVRINTNTTSPMYVLETEGGQSVNGGREVEQKLLSKGP